jgi:hypothetical protein
VVTTVLIVLALWLAVGAVVGSSVGRWLASVDR